MKKLLALLLVLAMTFAMVACAPNSDGTTDDSTAGNNQPVNTTSSNTNPEDTKPEEPIVDNTLVEYYMQKANEVKITDTDVTFTDDSGRGEITIAKNPQKVAILYPSLTCLWYETGATAPLIVGGKSGIQLYEEQIGRDITKDEGITVVSTSSSGTGWDVEAIIANKPDLIDRKSVV